MTSFKSGTWVVKTISAVFAIAITFGIAETISSAMIQAGEGAEQAMQMAKRTSAPSKATGS